MRGLTGLYDEIGEIGLKPVFGRFTGFVAKSMIPRRMMGRTAIFGAL